MSYELDELELYKNIINNLKNKKIVNYNNDIYDIKIYVSSGNLDKLKKNINNYNGYLVFDTE